MCPRSSTPRVISMLRYMPRRSSRSRPASLTSDSEPTGSASRAIAIQIPSSLETADTLSARSAVTFTGRGLRLTCGKGSGLAAGAALAVAVLAATPLGHAAGKELAAVVPFAKTAGFAKQAGNAAKLNGRRSTLSGAPKTIPVVGANGKLPATIGAIGPQGPAGPK